MKTKSIITLIALTLVGSSGAFAQGGQGRGGFGGPPKSGKDLAARQAGCPSGSCNNNGQRRRMRQGQGQGQGRGLRDGSGPRTGTGLCPNSN